MYNSDNILRYFRCIYPQVLNKETELWVTNFQRWIFIFSMSDEGFNENVVNITWYESLKITSSPFKWNNGVPQEHK